MKILYFLLFLSTSAQGSLVDYSKELIESAYEVKESRMQFQFSELDKTSFEGTLNPTLELAQNYNKNELENFTGFSASINGGVARFPLVTSSSFAKLTMPFTWGGRFYVDTTFQKSELEGQTPVYGLTQTVGYEQDLWSNFFGRKYHDKLSSFSYAVKSAKFNKGEQEDKILYDFSLLYTSAFLSKQLLSYQQEAIKRIERRVALVKKRVRNGVSEKIDLIQSRSSLLDQREVLLTRQRDLQDQIVKMEQQLGKKVDVASVKRDANLFDESKLEANVTSSSRLNSLEMAAQSSLYDYKDADHSTYPSLTLSGSLKNNNYDEFRSELTGSQLRDNKEVNVSLNLKWTIGADREKSDRAKRFLEKEVNRLKYETELKRSEDELKLIAFQIDKMNQHISFAKKKLKLAKQTLKEYEKLYKRGRADFDQVIQADENIIANEEGLSRYENQRDQLILRGAYLTGHLKKMLRI